MPVGEIRGGHAPPALKLDFDKFEDAQAAGYG